MAPIANLAPTRGSPAPQSRLAMASVLSTGQAVETTAAFHSRGDSPDTDTGQPGTAAFDAYGPGHITNFISSLDVVALQVNFTLNAASQVGFNFIFWSVEYPVVTY